MRIKYLFYQFNCRLHHKVSDDFIEWLAKEIFIRKRGEVHAGNR